MSTITARPKVETLPEQRFVLYGEPWETYVRLLHLFDERRHLRITYDRGALEIMTLSAEHEQIKRLIARLIATLTEELNMPLAEFGSMTMKRRRNQRGLEPDECFWIANESLVRNLKKYVPRRDPPPDLVVEVEVSRSAINRLAIYASWRVPEVWRIDDRGVHFLILQTDRSYAEGPRSLSFASVAPADINRFLELRGKLDNTAIICQFREWLRTTPAAPPSPQSRTAD